MKNSILKTLAAIVTITALFFFVYIVRGALYGGGVAYESGIIPPVMARSTSVISYGYAVPVRLFIPSIEVDAKVQQVGLTKTNAMGIPSNFTDVAWYKYGPIPGEIGGAVIDGHVDNALALPGVFKKLDQVKVGDDIYIADKAEKNIHFIVTKIDTYDYNAAPAGEIFNDSSGKARLRLITCGGTWIKEKRTYDKRLIVTAELVTTLQ